MNVVYTPTKMFAERAEHVYFLASGEVPRFMERVGEHLGVHCFYASDLEVDEPPAHYVTTLYFDSESRELVRACEEGLEGVKLRAREYYDCDRQRGIRREPLLWLEVKTRVGASTRKTRFAIQATEVAEFMRAGGITEQMIRGRRSSLGRSAQAVTDAIVDVCSQVAGPLEPDCLAHYRRRAWQDSAETLRITLDTDLHFHRPPANLFCDGGTLCDAVAGPPLAELGHSLVEIKLRRDPPSWLVLLTLELGLEPALDGQRGFSKFVAASRAVHSPTLF